MYNLIIVDKSGSMSPVTNATIAGVNETIGSIQAAARKNPEQKQLVSLLTFCGCERNYIFENTPAEETRFITYKDYNPCCNTPLYDSVGFSCTSLEKQMGDDKFSTACVTIITDGYENSSTEYDRNAIAALITRLKENGWMFAYVGADHDVHKVAIELKIDNVMQFDKNEADIKRMFEQNEFSRERFSVRFSQEMKEAHDSNMCEEEILELKRRNSKEYYDGL